MKLRNLVFILACILVLASCSKKTEEAAGVNTLGTAGYQYFKDTGMWKNIFNHTQAFVVPKNLTPTSIMIPHHDIAIGNQNSFYKALSPLCKPSVVVIISPDHFERGKKIITMPQNTVFSSPEGDHVLDKEIIKKISEDKELSSYVSLQDDLWFEEHGIFSHTPFIKHYFPDARVVPVVLKMLSKDDEFEKYKALGKLLAKILPEDSLVIASVDCSHYQIPSVTAFHDYVIVDTLMRMENPRYAEIDSPESMTVLFSYNEAKGAVNPVLIHQSSTYDFIPRDDVESTSHIYVTYYKNSPSLNSSLDDYYEEVKNTSQRGRRINDEVSQTLFIAGSGKTGAGIRKTWEWDRYDTFTDPADKLLKALAGKEARFLYGFDAVIFDPEPGTVYERTLHNTKLTVKTIMQSDFEKQYGDNFYKAGSEKKSSGEKVIKVLEVVYEGDKNAPSDDFVNRAIKDFHIVVFRDDEGIKDAVLYCRKKTFSSEYVSVNLGICHGLGHIKGNVAFINFSGADVNLLTFAYESDDGIIPAIHQFNPDDIPLEAALPAPGDREN